MYGPLSRSTAAVVAVAGLTLTLAACGTDGEQGAGDTELTVAVSKIAASVDPSVDLSASYLRAVGAAEGLMKVQPDGTVAPELALSVEQDDARTWTVTLDPERTFWSGDPVDAEAVAASLQRSVELSALGASQLAGVTTEVVDPATLRLVTEQPRPALPDALAHYQLVIHNAEAYGEEAGTVDVDEADLTGPYRLTGFRTERDMTLEANDSWWGGEPGFETVTVTAVADAQARAELAVTGQADIVAEFPVERAGELTDAELVSTAAANTVAVYLNPSSAKAPALADQRVRQALALGVDRESLIDLVAGGLVDPAGSWLSTSPVFADEELAEHTLDRDAAGKLLDEAGWPLVDGVRTKDGEPLILRLLTFGAEKADGEVLQAQWGELGITLDVRDVENTALAESIASGDWDMATQAWTTLGDHAALIAGQIGPDAAANHARLVLDEVPELLEQASGAPTAEARTEALVALDALITENVPLVPLHPRVVATAVADGIDGFDAHALQYETLVTGALAVS